MLDTNWNKGILSDPFHWDNNISSPFLLFQFFSCFEIPNINVMVIIEASCNNIFLISNYCRNPFLCTFEFSYLLAFWVPCKNRWFSSHLTGINNFSVVFMLIKANDIIIVGIKECLITVLCVHQNSQACCVIGNNILINISKIAPTIFCSVSMCKLELKFYRRSFTSTFVSYLSRLFDCSFPRLNSHELIPLIFLFLEIIHHFGSNFFILFNFWNSNLFS